MLSYPSPLQSHSDFPTPLTPHSPVLSGLKGAYRSRILRERQDLRFYICNLSSHAIGLTSGSLQVLVPFSFLADTDLPPSTYRVGVYPVSYRFIPKLNSPSNNCSASSYEAAPFALCYGLRFWLASLTGYDIQVPDEVSAYIKLYGSVPTTCPVYLLNALSRQVQPVCYHTNPPPAY